MRHAIVSRNNHYRAIVASGKTTLLFHWAIAVAQASDAKVVFITQSKAQLAAHKPLKCSLRPLLPQAALERVELRYLAE